MGPPLGQNFENRRARHLDGPHGRDAERASLFLLRDHRVVLQGDLRVESIGEHPLVLSDELGLDANVAEAKAGQFGQIAVVFGIQAGAKDVDEADGTLLPSA